MRLLLIIAVFLFGCGKRNEMQQDLTRPEGPGQNETAGMSTEVGAGGSGVLCNSKSAMPEYFEALDVYEARKRNMPPNLGSENVNVTDKIEIGLSRLTRLSPLREARYRTRAQFILSKAQFFREGYLPHIADEDPQDLGKGCRLVQIATRRKPIFENDPEFLIDGKLWDRLSNDNKAALILHEIIYEEASKEFGHRSSRMSRAFNSLIFSGSIENLSTLQFFNFLDKIEFTFTDYGGVRIPTKVIGDNYGTGLWIEESDELIASSEIVRSVDELIPRQAMTYNGKELILGGGVRLRILIRKGAVTAVSGYVSNSGEPIEDRGNILRLYVSNGITIFRDDGKLALVSVKKGSVLKLAEGSQTLAEPYACVHLSEDGLAKVVGPICSQVIAQEMNFKLPDFWKEY